MGITITAKNSGYEFDMGYGGFFNLRRKIALALDKVQAQKDEVALMALYCPAKDGPALYPECKECEDRLCEAFYCLVVGSRTFDDYELMKKKLDHILKNYHRIVIVSGGARGADSLAERYAKEKGYPLKVFPAEWDK